jgi:hypothetical protein
LFNPDGRFVVMGVDGRPVTEHNTTWVIAAFGLPAVGSETWSNTARTGEEAESFYWAVGWPEASATESVVRVSATRGVISEDAVPDSSGEELSLCAAAATASHFVHATDAALKVFSWAAPQTFSIHPVSDVLAVAASATPSEETVWFIVPDSDSEVSTLNVFDIGKNSSTPVASWPPYYPVQVSLWPRRHC